MEFPKLYSRSTTGAITTWQIFAENGAFYTIAGQLDGKKVTSKPHKCEPKNENKANATTKEGQAELEAASKFEKKKKEGYHESIDDVDKVAFFEPMLAKHFEDYEDKVKYPVGVEPKLNGCFSEETFVLTKEFGHLTIKDIVDNRLQCSVESFNMSLKRREFKRVVNYFKDKSEENEPEWFKITLDDGRILNVTGNHELFMPELKCFRRVKDLTKNDVLLISTKK